MKFTPFVFIPVDGLHFDTGNFYKTQFILTSSTKSVKLLITHVKNSSAKKLFRPELHSLLFHLCFRHTLHNVLPWSGTRTEPKVIKNISLTPKNNF